MSEYERDLDQLLIVLEILTREIKGIKRRRYYRNHRRKKKALLDSKINDALFNIYAKTGRKWKGKTRIVMTFD